MSRYAKHRRVFFFEEPVFNDLTEPFFHLRETREGVQVVIPHLPKNLTPSQQIEYLSEIVEDLILEEDLENYTLWYYTPMALPFSRFLRPKAVIFDCMDELSKFKGAPSALLDLETELLNRADLVFTGGYSLFEAKKHRHTNIHPFPSSIDFAHFSKGREVQPEPYDQGAIPRPRIGFFGVIDERMNVDLLDSLARLKPEWQFVMIGPVVKIDPVTLPRRQNIHYLGKKEYQELPQYLAGWDCAMMPFMKNDSTEFISPTKTPEYLAAGRPVVSTSIRDVVQPYGHEKMVYIADTAHEFIESIHQAMVECKINSPWRLKVDRFLSGVSWNQTWKRMAELEQDLLSGTISAYRGTPRAQPVGLGLS